MSIIFLPKIALNQRLYNPWFFFPDLESNFKFNLAYWESSAVFQEHSNYVHYAASWILPQIRKKTPWVIYVAFGRVQFLAKIRQTLRSTFRTLFERSFHADHNGTVPLASYMYLIHVSRYDVSYIWQWIHDHFKYARLQVHCPNSMASYHVHVHTFYTRWIWNWCTHVQWKGHSGIMIISS